ncbi:MAG: DUF3352 domain-containing protein [Pyrinomonadaceae bacterium]|nr:DUF3352 domain-containing protein [Pyrinomonadaceae bacterium]
MNICQSAAISARLLLTLLLIAAPLNAQRRRPEAPKPSPAVQPNQPALTFETLLAADSYKIYGEVRGVGPLLRISGINDILDPVMKLAAPPKEFKTLVRWLNSHADELMTSRLMFAAWPSRPKLPQALFVIEFPSAEEAQKFESQLKEFLPKFLPTPAPVNSPISGPGKNEPAEAKPKQTPSPPPPYILKQSGALVFISESQFTFKALRPTGSKLLAEDQNFRQVHDRLSSESVFLYFDMASAEKEEQERMLKMQEEVKKQQESAAPKLAPADAQSRSDTEVTPELVPVEPSPPAPAPPASAEATLGTSSPVSQGDLGPEITIASTSGLDRLASALFFGIPRWPEAIGVALAFDADTYVVRALLVNSPEVKGNAIPFAPQLVSGPPLTPEASSVLPASTELLVTLSLDLPLIYEGTLRTVFRESELRRTKGQTIEANQPESPFAVYEKKLGLKIREDLLPLFGNEVALSVKVKTLGLSGPYASPSATPEKTDERTPPRTAPATSGPEPVIAISIKDKEAVRALMPKIIDAVGFKGASQLAQSEKRDDTELVNYANAIAYAFIGNFLIVSSDAKAVRYVVDSYLNHQTLAGNSSFRNSTRWQPRQVLGQVYVSPALMESFSGFSKDLNLVTNDTLRDFVLRLSPTPEAATYAISNEGLGALHELHVPKNLVLLMIAGFATESHQLPLVRNEAIAQSALRMLVSAEATYQATKGDGNYGTLDQLVAQRLVPKELLQQHGYKIELSAMGSKFEATAVPLEHGKTGKISFFIDESGVLRGADHGGGAATVADKPLQ